MIETSFDMHQLIIAVSPSLNRSRQITYNVYNFLKRGKSISDYYQQYTEFIDIGNEVTGNKVVYKEVTDEENYQIFDAMGVPRTTDGKFKDGSEAPFSSEGMVTFAQAIRENKMDSFTDDFKKLTGSNPILVRQMFENQQNFQIGSRHSKD